MLYNVIYQYLSYTTFILFLFMAFIPFSYKRKRKINYYFTWLLFTGGYHYFYFWAFSLGFFKYVPFLINTEICAGYLMAPLAFFYFSALTSVKTYTRPFILAHLTPFFISLAIIIFLNLTDPSIYANYIMNKSLYPDYTGNSTIFIINYIVDIYIGIYVIASLVRISVLLRIKKKSKEIKIVRIILLLVIAAQFLFLLADISGKVELFLFAFLSIPVILIFLIIFYFRYPDFAIQTLRETKNFRYQNSIMKKHDASVIENRLVQLMEEEKIFTNLELTLKSLSKTLMISTHELSHLINNRFKQNFNTYINSYRIKEAKKMLADHPEKSIIEISFFVGFSSKSSFYNYFERETNESPRDYRNRILKK